MLIRTCSLIATTIYPGHSVGTVRAFVGVRPPRLFHRSSFPPTNMLSADFCYAIVSPYGSLSPLMDTRQISRGKHASFRTRTPSIPTWVKMDRGLYLVLSAGDGSHQVRLTRFLSIAPCVRGALPRQGGFLPEHRHRIPSCHTAIPFASIRLGLGLDELQN